MSSSKALVGLLLLVLGACAQTETGPGKDGGAPDSYQGEVALDTFVPPGDTLLDTHPDTRSDSLADTLADALVDTKADTLADALVDTKADTLPDALVDTQADTLADSLVDTQADTLADSLVDMQADTLVDTQTDLLGDALADVPQDSALEDVSLDLAQDAQPDLAQDTVVPCGGPCPEAQVCYGPTNQCVPDPRCMYDFCPTGPYGTSRLEIGGVPVYMEVLESTEAGATLPTDRLTFERAAGACFDRGRRLCTAAEYQQVCGAPGTWFYGASYDAQVCNAEGEGPAASGSHGACAVGDPAVFDLIGNLAEWTLEGLLFGGSYMDGEAARCTALDVENHGTLNLATLGFRCCLSPVDDLDGDGTSARDDCADMDPLVNPRADEVCNGLDDDCDGETDEGDLDWLCDDGDQCRQEFCERGVGCKDQHLTGLCDDGEPCTVEDKCVDGACVGSPKVCDDHKACTEDKCLQGTGCVFEFLSSDCDDGDLCTAGDYCTDGLCTPGDSTDCDDANPCTDDSCVTATGCKHVNNQDDCDDQDPCTVGDVCGGGECVAGTRICTCLSSADCGTYDDNDLCNGTYHCTSTLPHVCEVDPATIKTCPESTDPCQAYGCDPLTGECALEPANNGFACDDGQGCTDGDLCAEGVCAGQSCSALGKFCYLGSCVDCVPECSGKLCGDDGCGGVCGLCEVGQECDAGTCCTPACLDIHCGDNGCGGVCGLCLEGQLCTFEGMCCSPHCEGKTCGSDGCGGDCGTCGEGALCTHGNCCVPACDGKNCGDDGCGGTCGICPPGGSCLDGLCCLPDCSGKVCGSDGCGGTCGSCSGDLSCVLGQCKGCGDGKCEGGETKCNCEADCGAPSCAGKTCGDDGCGGSCGTCTAPKTCQSGTCVCTPNCAGKTCGDNGCGGTCGTCTTGNFCSTAGACTKATYDGVNMVKSIFNKSAAKCAQCHTGSSASNCQMGSNDCLSSHYADTQKNAGTCPGKKVGECALSRVNANTMPPGPVSDKNKCGVGVPCFSDTEKVLIQAWINGGFPQN